MHLRQNGRDRVGTPRIVPRMDSPESPNRGCAELLLSSTASSSSDRQIANVAAAATGSNCHRVCNWRAISSGKTSGSPARTSARICSATSSGAVLGIARWRIMSVLTRRERPRADSRCEPPSYNRRAWAIEYATALDAEYTAIDGNADWLDPHAGAGGATFRHGWFARRRTQLVSELVSMLKSPDQMF